MPSTTNLAGNSRACAAPARAIAQPRHLPQQRPNVVRVGVGLQDGSQVVLGERGLESNGGVTVYPYSVLWRA